jgi:D-glycero-D-manno-heptose 1,7-bisphosphate phosphatase
VRVVFADRDGVINRDRDEYVRSVEEFEFLPGALEALKRLREAGWLVVVISNQAGVGKGLMSEEALAEIDRLMTSEVSAAGGRIEATYYCPHRQQDGCDCRKPAPGLIRRASRDLGIEPEDAVFVGDSARDILAGQAVGCRTVAVLSGSLTGAEVAALDPPPDLVADNLAEAADWIIRTTEAEP